MQYLDEHIAAKKAIYERYKEGFKDLPVSLNPYDEQNAEPNFWITCMVVNKEAMSRQIRNDSTVTYDREHGKTCPSEILDALKSINAEGRPIWKPMHMQPLFESNDYISANGSTGEDLFERGLCLPCDIKMTPGQQDAIIEVVKCCFG